MKFSIGGDHHPKLPASFCSACEGLKGRPVSSPAQLFAPEWPWYHPGIETVKVGLWPSQVRRWRYPRKCVVWCTAENWFCIRRGQRLRRKKQRQKIAVRPTSGLINGVISNGVDNLLRSDPSFQFRAGDFIKQTPPSKTVGYMTFYSTYRF